MANKGQKRKDKDRIVLKVGESQRKNGSYQYRWSDRTGRRHYVYAKTLEELREKEKTIVTEQNMGITSDARTITVNDLYQSWVQLKKGLKNNTFKNYQYMYEQFVLNNYDMFELDFVMLVLLALDLHHKLSISFFDINHISFITINDFTV